MFTLMHKTVLIETGSAAWFCPGRGTTFPMACVAWEANPLVVSAGKDTKYSMPLNKNPNLNFSNR